MSITMHQRQAARTAAAAAAAHTANLVDPQQALERAWHSTTPDARTLDGLPDLSTPSPRNVDDWRRMGWSETAAADLAAINARLETATVVTDTEPYVMPHIHRAANGTQHTATRGNVTPIKPGADAPGQFTPHNALHSWGRISHATTPEARDEDVIRLMGGIAQSNILRRQEREARLAEWRSLRAASNRVARAQPLPAQPQGSMLRLLVGAGLSIAALVAVGVAALTSGGGVR